MNDETSIEVFHNRMNRTASNSAMIVTSIIGLVVFSLVLFGLVQLFNKFTFLMYLILIVVVLFIVLVPTFLIALAIKFVLKPSYKEISANGIVVTNLLGSRQFAPLKAIEEPKVTTSKTLIGTTKIELALPTFLDCVKQQIVKQETEEYFIGFSITAFKKMIQEPLYTVGRTTSLLTGGKSGSGKTRFELSIVFQMIYKKKIVIVCDPHFNKPDGLINLMGNLKYFCIIAKTGKEIVNAVKQYRNEMELRKTLESEIVSQLSDMTLILEELRAIMKGDDISDFDKEMILETIERAETEYRGFKGFVYVTSQSFKVQDVGSTNIRSQISNKLILSMIYREANYVVEDDRIAKSISKIAKRTVLYVSDELDETELHAKIADIPDGIGNKLAAYLKLKNFPSIKEMLAVMEQTKKQTANNLLTSTHIGVDRQIAPISESAYKHDSTMNKPLERLDDDMEVISSSENEQVLISANERFNSSDDTIEKVVEQYTGKDSITVFYQVLYQNNGIRVVEYDDKRFRVTEQEVTQLLASYAELSLNDKEVSRRDLMKYLNAIDKNTWNNGKWNKFAYICYSKGI